LRRLEKRNKPPCGGLIIMSGGDAGNRTPVQQRPTWRALRA
jgi:hypothetical protein